MVVDVALQKKISTNLVVRITPASDWVDDFLLLLVILLLIEERRVRVRLRLIKGKTDSKFRVPMHGF